MSDHAHAARSTCERKHGLTLRETVTLDVDVQPTITWAVDNRKSSQDRTGANGTAIDSAIAVSVLVGLYACMHHTII